MDKAICTVAEAANWFGERGMPVRANNIRVRGRWVLVKEEWSIEDNEVDCYDLSSGSMYAEPWDAIKYTDSPFVPRNDERTEIALTEIEKSWISEHNEEFQWEGLCLIALSGDCAKGGMGNSNEVLPFRPEHNSLVKTFLKAQLAYDMHLALNRYSSNGLDFESPKTKTAYENEAAAGRALIDAGVFHHKYHQRTTWELAYMDELNVINRYKPFVVMYPKPNEGA